MKFRVIIAVLLLAAVSTQQSVFAEVSDPTTETWAHPTRISPISGLEEHTGDSELFFYNNAWYIALSSFESTILTTVDESGYLSQDYLLLEDEVAPRIIDHNEMMYLSTIRVSPSRSRVSCTLALLSISRVPNEDRYPNEEDLSSLAFC